MDSNFPDNASHFIIHKSMNDDKTLIYITDMLYNYEISISQVAKPKFPMIISVLIISIETQPMEKRYDW